MHGSVASCHFISLELIPGSGVDPVLLAPETNASDDAGIDAAGIFIIMLEVG